MKRTLNINIGNSLILIEEDAYELLTSYLNEIKAHFARNADDFEIVTDIENRIAEMFIDILATQQKQVISIDDVRLVMAQMGSVRDFEMNEEAEEPVTAPFSTGIKRLYRDTEQGMVAGVCAGLGHYLNVEARWVRLFALLSIFMGGAGFLAYLVMWIMVPRATTRSEKMYMKGEAVNLQGFIRNFQEELENNQLMQRSSNFIVEMGDGLGRFITSAGAVILKIIAGIIILIASFTLLGFVVALAGLLGFSDQNPGDIFPFSMVNAADLPMLLTAAFICVAIPLLALILFAVRVAFNGRPLNKSLAFGLLIIWILGFAAGIFYVAKVSSEFKQEAEFTQTTSIKPYSVYTLTLNNSKFFSREDSIKYQINTPRDKGRIILEDEDHDFNTPRNVRISIEPSLDGKYAILENYSAKGKTFDVALKHAQNIRYDFKQQDSLLNFSPRLHLNKNVNWRDQEVKVTIKVPVGTKLIMSHELDRYLDQYSSWSCNDHDDRHHDFTEWQMTADGLKCMDELNRDAPLSEN
jgi:phage shock protein PspC (stress-responsive transcriptional regulator)